MFDHPSHLSGLRFGAGEVDGGLCLEAAVNVIIKVCMYVCMYVCVNINIVCMYVCMYVYSCGNQASLKSVVESVRMWILSYDTYMQLQMDITFIKQVYICMYVCMYLYDIFKRAVAVQHDIVESL